MILNGDENGMYEELWKEQEELEARKDLRIFVVCYTNGNFHSMTIDQEKAYDTALKIDGILGELTNVHKPLTEKDIPAPILAEVINAFENPKSRVRRDLPKRRDAA